MLRERGGWARMDYSIRPGPWLTCGRCPWQQDYICWQHNQQLSNVVISRCVTCSPDFNLTINLQFRGQVHKILEQIILTEALVIQEIPYRVLWWFLFRSLKQTWNKPCLYFFLLSMNCSIDWRDLDMRLTRCLECKKTLQATVLHRGSTSHCKALRCKALHFTTFNEVTQHCKHHCRLADLNSFQLWHWTADISHGRES